MLSKQHIKRPAALALVLAAIAPATASAMPIGPGGPGGTPMPLQTSIVRVTVPNSGFDWGDAGIGAAGGFAISLIGLGGALAVTGRRGRRAHRAAAARS